MFLKELLENDHPLFTVTMNQLEQATGNAGVDARLIADITQKAHEAMRSLGLDPSDTTGVELYNALKNTVRNGSAETILAPLTYTLLNLGDGPISFNIQDVIENAHHELAYVQRQTGHGKRHLRLEIVKRYAQHDRTHDEIVHKLAQEIGLKTSEDETYPEISSNEKKPSLLAVGDIFTDVFIQLREDIARVETDDKGSKWLSVPFGSKPPYDGAEVVQAVGPSPNAAVAVSRLGLATSLMAFLGKDRTGEESLSYLHKEGIDTSLVAAEDGLKSNCYYVLRYGAERTILVKNESYDYKWREPESPPDWIYLSLISKSAWQLHEDLLRYLSAHPQIKLAFQPGTFHFEWGTEKLKEIYNRSYIVVMNREEAALVTEKSAESIKELASALHGLGPKVVIITDGSAGSYASYDKKVIKMPNYPDPAPPYDRTGAGDAFASTIVAALALGETIETALQWAPINSMSVVQKLGAQAGLLKRNEIEKYLQDAPAEYKAEEL
ncbi:MAG TPA: carbohydrate kinase family protein [Candidatus Saccharimonadales bacterium]|nr:carbohydrate kinase family protein [Candidatus Saccharimonadales bacterium]